jgi:hypothetical protein
VIILLGPDGTGKTTLAKRLEGMGLKYYHFTKDSKYNDYISPLCKLEMTNAVLDRHALCEYPYSICMERAFKFNIKEWHNILMLTLIQNPLIILCTHKPNKLDYDESQYLPYDRWDMCMKLYKEFLDTNHISYINYDYMMDRKSEDRKYVELSLNLSLGMKWWHVHWSNEYGCIGYPHPKFLLVAERIGPNNMNNIPFETGPTGWMLSNMIQATKIPLGALAVTNMVKSFRRDARDVNENDLVLLQEEITNLKPKKVIFMGSPAKRGIPLAKSLGVDTDMIVHLGALNHRGVKDMSGYYNEWRKIVGMVPKLKYE